MGERRVVQALFGEELGLMRKDVRTARDFLPDGSLLRSLLFPLLDDAVESEGYDADYTAVVRLLEKRAGAELRHDAPAAE